MKKFLWLFVSILTLGLTLPNYVNAETIVQGFKESVEDEIKTMESLKEQYPDEYKEAGYDEYVQILKKADFSNYQESDDKVNVYIFRGSTCGYCLKALVYFTSIIPEYGNYFNLKSYEVWSSEDNSKLLETVGAVLKSEVKGVPYIIIGDTVFPGYTDSYNSEIEAKIKSEYESKDRYDVMQHLDEANNTADTSNVKNTNTNNTLLWVILSLQIVSISGLAGFIYSTNKENKEFYLSKINSLEKKIAELNKTPKTTKTEKAKKTTKKTK